jgi:hypothetical protein
MSRLRLPVFGFLLVGIFFVSGCSLCCSPYTDDYLTHGSRTPRLDMKHGRVGSILSDQSAMTGADANRSNEGMEYGLESAEGGVLEEEAISLGTDR